MRRTLVTCVLLVIVVVAAGVGYWSHWINENGRGQRGVQSSSLGSIVRIVLAAVTLNVEIAETPADQQRGLSGRDSMPLNSGMLFVFNSEGNLTFWMNGMRFPLDIIWFDSQRRAVHTEQDLPPCTSQNCPAYTPPVNALYVLEVNAGFVQAHNVSLGDQFNFVE